ncbi:hypothetical protein [Enterococcus sp. AZ072]|uniref:hypothetical protein n=1 Tax=unclassified Enterococcus TaxID=2608891 RepID=UPI003D2D8B3A
MKFSFEVETELTPEQIWPYYAEVNNWYKWEDDLQKISLEGAFETGTTGEMTLDGQPPMAFTLTSVKTNEYFTDETTIPHAGTISFHHELERLGEKTCIRHSVEFKAVHHKENVKDSQFLLGIFSDVPASVFALIKAAR